MVLLLTCLLPCLPFCPFYNCQSWEAICRLKYSPDLLLCNRYSEVMINNIHVHVKTPSFQVFSRFPILFLKQFCNFLKTEMLYVINRFFFNEVSFSILSLEHSFLQMHKRTTGMRNSEVRLLIIALKQMFVFFQYIYGKIEEKLFSNSIYIPQIRHLFESNRTKNTLIFLSL